MRRLPFVVLLLLAVPSAQGAQTFYLGPDEVLSTQPLGSIEDPLGNTIAWGFVQTPATGRNTAFYETRLTQPGSILPVASTFNLQVLQPTVVAPVGIVDLDVCAVEVFVGVFDPTGNAVRGYWYYCWAQPTGTVLLAGTRPFVVDWSQFSLTPVEAKAGDYLYTSIWSFGSSTALVPTLYAQGSNGVATLVVEGTDEPVPSAAPADPPAPASSSSSSSSSSSTSSSPPSSTSSSSSSSSTTASPAPPEASSSTTTAPPADQAQDPQTAQDAPGVLVPGMALVLVAIALALRRRGPPDGSAP
jgi:hypothetical protein